MKKKLTINQSEYRRIRKNLLRNISRAKKRGYTYSDEFLNLVSNAKMPKRVTQKRLKELQELASSGHYKYSTYASDLTYGVSVSGLTGRSIERSAAAHKGVETKRRAKEHDTGERGVPIKESGARRGGSYRDTDTGQVYHVDSIEEIIKQLERIPHVKHVRRSGRVFITLDTGSMRDSIISGYMSYIDIIKSDSRLYYHYLDYIKHTDILKDLDDIENAYEEDDLTGAIFSLWSKLTGDYKNIHIKNALDPTFPTFTDEELDTYGEALSDIDSIMVSTLSEFL